MKTFALVLLAFVMGIGSYALYQQSTVEAAPQIDTSFCNAKYANWIIRHEELAKPQPEQYHNFKRHMGECVR